MTTEDHVSPDRLFTAGEPYEVTQAEQEAYRAQGFFVARNLVTPPLLMALAQRLDAAARGELNEGIHRQVEPGVKDRGEPTGDPIDHIRKVQRLAGNDPFFNRFVTHPRLLSLIHGLYGANIRYFGDEAQLKPARVGSAPPWPQDAPYFHSEPMDVATVWIAVDDATRENGCIEVIPGAHRQGVLPRPDSGKAWFEEGEFDVSDAVHAEVSAGDAIIFDLQLPHGSGPNHSNTRRRSMICRYVNLDTVKPHQLQVIETHGVLSDDPKAHPIFAPVS